MNKQKGSVLVTPRSLSRSGHPALQPLKDAGFEVLMPWPGRQPNEEQLLEVLPSCRAYLAGVEPITERVLAASPELRIISRNGVGMDNIDLDAAQRLGIEVKGTPGANSQGVAELALALIFDCARAVSWSDSRLKSGGWSRRKGRELSGKTLGVIGCGNIGRRLARMAAGIGMQVLGYDLFRDEELANTAGFSYAELNKVLAESDVISLHCPPADKPLLTAETLSLTRRGAAVVNTARDSLVNHAALLNALEKGQISAYAADVYDREPPELDALLLHERVVTTPHIGGFTEESVERATAGAVEHIIRCLG